MSEEIREVGLHIKETTKRKFENLRDVLRIQKNQKISQDEFLEQLIQLFCEENLDLAEAAAHFEKAYEKAEKKFEKVN